MRLELPLRLAVYGHLNQNAGSSSASHYLLVEELLRRGHEIDLYAIDGYVTPQNLVRFSHLAYLPVSLPTLDALFLFCYKRLPGAIGWFASRVVNTIRHYCYNHALERLIRRRHRARPYDALLVVDLASPFRAIASLPCINWAQGSAWGELDALRRQRPAIIHYSGAILYWGLVLYYRIRIALVRRHRVRCSRLICCSRWTASSWVEQGFPVARIAVIPFALDLITFRPPTGDGGPGPITFLHLGRLAPRKRLDLLLEAFRGLRHETPDVRLLVIGGFPYAQGFRALLAPDRIPPGVDYRERIARAAVPDLLRGIDVLVQTSENEDFGSAVMEALGCGVPVIVGPTNGTGEYASSGCFAFERYETEAVLEAMRRAVHAIRDDRASVRKAARHAAETNFRVEDVARRVLELVDAVRPTVAFPRKP